MTTTDKLFFPSFILIVATCKICYIITILLYYYHCKPSTSLHRVIITFRTIANASIAQIGNYGELEVHVTFLSNTFKFKFKYFYNLILLVRQYDVNSRLFHLQFTGKFLYISSVVSKISYI